MEYKWVSVCRPIDWGMGHFTYWCCVCFHCGIHRSKTTRTIVVFPQLLGFCMGVVIFECNGLPHSQNMLYFIRENPYFSDGKWITRICIYVLIVVPSIDAKPYRAVKNDRMQSKLSLREHISLIIVRDTECGHIALPTIAHYLYHKNISCKWHAYCRAFLDILLWKIIMIRRFNWISITFNSIENNKLLHTLNNRFELFLMSRPSQS